MQLASRHSHVETATKINKQKKAKCLKQIIPLLFQSFWILFCIGDTIRTPIQVEWSPICSAYALEE